MNKYKHYLVIIILLSSAFLAVLQPVTAEKNDVILEFFYSSRCPACNQTKPLINDIENEYNASITVERYLVSSNKTSENYTLWGDYYGFQYVPAVVVSNQTNQTLFTYKQINKVDVENTINLQLFGEEPKQTTIVVEYYYDEVCGSCIELRDDIVKTAEALYVDNDSVAFRYKEITSNDQNFQEYQDYIDEYEELYGYPFIIIKHETEATPIPENVLDKEGIEAIKNTVNAYFVGDTPESYDTSEKDAHEVDFLFWHIKINISDYSLPVLTIVLGSLDSFNPCAFFILIFLLNILLYTKSRRRMILIGGIFIFFSGVLYAVFMFVLYESFLLTKEHITVVNIIAGSIALTLGIFSIKDFFFFKKGASLSIPDDKKPKLYKQMRDLVKNPRLTATIIGTIILAATVNFYELLCTLGLPLIFTRELGSYNLSPVESATYIFFYNVVYVIPLVIIVLIFVFTLGRRKITEWHGRIMKLMCGIMLSSFGILFLFDYTLLENIVTPVLLLIFSLLTTLIISFFWKKFTEKQEFDRNYPSE